MNCEHILSSRRLRLLGAAVGLLLSSAVIGGCGHRQAQLQCHFTQEFEGQEAQLIDFLTGDTVATDTIRDGMVEFRRSLSQTEIHTPRLYRIGSSGTTYCFYVCEPGKATASKRRQTAIGTPTNDRFAALMEKLDSVEAYDVMPLYADYALQLYNSNRDNLLGDFFATEVMRYVSLATVDSILANADETLREALPTVYFREQARIREATQPGRRYADMKGETADGTTIMLSDLVSKDKYTLLHFGGSWSPYSMKDIPVLRKLFNDFSPMVEVVGIAVRDDPENTLRAVKKHNIPWPVLYNTGNTATEVYGLSAIPLLILVAPDGTIEARGENIQYTRRRLEQLVADSRAHVR